MNRKIDAFYILKNEVGFFSKQVAILTNEIAERYFSELLKQERLKNRHCVVKIFSFGEIRNDRTLGSLKVICGVYLPLIQLTFRWYEGRSVSYSSELGGNGSPQQPHLSSSFFPAISALLYLLPMTF